MVLFLNVFNMNFIFKEIHNSNKFFGCIMLSTEENCESRGLTKSSKDNYILIRDQSFWMLVPHLDEWNNLYL